LEAAKNPGSSRQLVEWLCDPLPSGRGIRRTHSWIRHLRAGAPPPCSHVAPTPKFPGTSRGPNGPCHKPSHAGACGICSRRSAKVLEPRGPGTVAILGEHSGTRAPCARSNAWGLPQDGRLPLEKFCRAAPALCAAGDPARRWASKSATNIRTRRSLKADVPDLPAHPVPSQRPRNVFCPGHAGIRRRFMGLTSRDRHETVEAPTRHHAITRRTNRGSEFERPELADVERSVILESGSERAGDAQGWFWPLGMGVRRTGRSAEGQ